MAMWSRTGSLNRWGRTGVLLLAGALVLTACGRESTGTQEQASKQVAEGKAKGTISIWAMGTEGENLQVLAEDFEKENPGATVDVTAVPWDAAHDKLATAIAAGKTPDVSVIGTTWMGEFAETGALEPTPTGLIDSSAFFSGAWDSTVVSGTSYGVPWYVETRLIYYRKDLAEKAGLSEPKSWDDLTAFAQGLKEKGGAEQGLYLQPADVGTWQTFMPFAWQAGAELTDTSGSYTLDSPEMAEALGYYASFFDKGLSATKTPAPGALESGFVDGKIGAFVSGPWHIGLLAEQGGDKFLDKLGLAQMPTEQTGASFMGGGNLAVFKDAKNRDGAWKLVEYLTRPEVQQKWYATISDLPSVQSAWDSGELKSDPMIAEFGEQLTKAVSPPAVPTWEQVAAEIDAQIERVVRAGTSPAAAAKEMQSKAGAIGTGS